MQREKENRHVCATKPNFFDKGAKFYDRRNGRWNTVGLHRTPQAVWWKSNMFVCTGKYTSSQTPRSRRVLQHRSVTIRRTVFLHSSRDQRLQSWSSRLFTGHPFQRCFGVGDSKESSTWKSNVV